METPVEMGQTAASKPRSAALLRREDGVLDLRKKPRIVDTVVYGLLLFCGVISIFTTLAIVVVLVSDSGLFFNSRAWVDAKAPVAEEESDALLAENIDAFETTLALRFEGQRIPFGPEQFIQIGSETMRVVDRATRTITVERGLDGTQAAAHTSDEAVFPMREQFVELQSDISVDDTVLAIQPGFGREFVAGDEITIDQEIMLVTGVVPDALTVQRAYLDTEAIAHEVESRVEIGRRPTLGEYVTSTIWQPQTGNFGVWPLLNATLVISLLALLVAIPLGLASAIYLSEYASPDVRSVLKPILEILAGVPTVVFGFFALTFVTPLLQGILPQVQFYNMLSAGIVVGILLIPLISTMSEDALNAVPRALREASYGLGATKFETSVNVVLPAATSGIAAAFIVAMSRAVGETMIVALAAGAGPNFTFNVFQGAETITGHIARISGGDLSYGSVDYTSIFVLGLTLFLVTLGLNLISSYVSNRLREKY